MKTLSLRPSGIRGRLLALGVFAPICHLHAASGTWNVNAAGNWSDTANWTGGVVASGATFTADFGTLNITGDHVVNIDAPFTIGTLRVQDATTASNSWVFSGTGPLTLDNGGNQPVLNILNRTPTISAPLVGSNGFSKTGAGTINLSGNNAGLSGIMNLQDVGGTNGAGVVLNNDTAVGGISTINVNGTSGSGQFLALNGGVTLESGVTINLASPGGNNAPPGGLRGEGANTVVNTINGPLNVNLTNSRISNNTARRLDLNGVLTAGSNSVVFRAAANEGIHLTNPSNSWTGPVVHSGGTLWFEPGTMSTGNLQIAASDPGTIQTNGTFNRALGTNAGEVQFTNFPTRAMGISARGGALSVNFGGAGAELFFDTSATPPASAIRTNTLVLNNATSDSKLTLVNPINLNGVARTLQVDSNTVELTGGLKGGIFAYTKTGPGTLLLSNANTWLGDLTIASAADSVNGGIVRVTHSEGLGPVGSPKNINAMGLNRGTSLVELSGGITIDETKTLRMWGKNLAMNGATGGGLAQSLRSVSGNNAWNGSVSIFNSGGAYGIEVMADTLTIGASPATASVMRNDFTASTRVMALYGAGNIVINNKIADNGGSNIGISKVGSGKLTITRTDNDFDVAPNLFAGTTEISSLAGTGIASSLGLASAFNLGSTLRYVGTGDTSDRTLGLVQTGGTLDASGGGALVLNSSNFTHHAGVTATVASPFALGATELVLNDVAGIALGQSIAGTNIPANTTITALNVDTRTVTISQPTSAASVNGLNMTIGGAAGINRTLTLTGTNTGDNSLAAPLSNPGITGLLGVTKNGPGKWLLNGTSHTYTGPTTLNQGTLAFDGAFPLDTDVTTAAGTTLSLANLSVRVQEDTGRALDIDGALVLAGPVTVVLPQASPSGSQTVLEYGSITGAANLISYYRGTVFTPGASSTSVAVGAGLPLIWTGATDGSWDVKATPNWKNGVNAFQFFWGDPVRFDDSAGFASFVSLSGELRPASVTIDADTSEYILDGSTGFLSGAFTLTKTGSALATIGGANTFTGGVVINEGILKPQGNQALGGTGNNITVASGAQLDTNGAMNANRDYDALIAGTGTDGNGAIVNTGTFHNNGFGSLTLSGNASIGGLTRWDVRPITAGQAFVDLDGFALNKIGDNYIGFIDGSLTEPGTINVNDGTLGFTRMVVSGAGAVNVNTGALLQFENFTTGSFEKPINLNEGSMRLQGSNLTTPSNVTITGNSIFDVENARTLTITSPVVGTGNLEKSTNTGGLTLTGTNTYDGTTLIGGGTLVIGSQTTAGTLGDGAVTNNGTLVINRPDNTYVVSNPISGTGALTIGQVSGGAFNSLVTVTGANSFAGGVTVNSGGLKIFNAGALGTGPKTITLTNGTNGRPQLYLDGTGGNITLPLDMSFVTSSGNTLEPAIGNQAGNNVVAGPITMTTGGGNTAVSVFGGTLALNGNISADATNRRLVLGGTAGSGTVGGIMADTGANVIGLDKVGSTVWTLTNNNTYTGTTAVNEGTLRINGNQGSAGGAVNVASGATLGGTGTVGGSINALAGSTVAPGTSIGTLTTTVPAVIAGNLAIELDGTSSDRLTVSGTLTITGATLNVTTLGAPGQAAYIIASYGILNGNFANTSGIPAGYAINYNYNAQNQIALVQTADAYGAFETANGIAGAGSNTDSDADGIKNGIEFVLGGDPSGPGSASNALLPTTTVDATYLNFVFRRTDESVSYNPGAQYGNSLTGWTTAQNGVNGVIVEVEDNFFNATTDRVTVRIPRALATPGTKLFARLSVNIP